MFKKLLTFVAAAAIAIGASATTLWTSDNAEGTLVDWGQPCFTMTAADVVATLAPGDYINLKVVGADLSNDWPQVALFAEYGGWPPLANEGVGKEDFPKNVSFPITYEIYKTISTDGLSVSGNGAYVGEVGYTKGEVEVGPFTVWFGNKACDWGNGVGLPASLFTDVEINGQLIFWTSDQSFQIRLGAWNGLNLPAYGWMGIPNMEVADGVTTLTLIDKYDGSAEYEVDDNGTMVTKEYDVFDLMKKNGVVMHGTTTLYRIDYIPGKPINEYNADVENVDALAKAFQEFVSDQEGFPGFFVLYADEIAALSATIEELNDKVVSAWETFGETGVYEGLTGAEVTEANETLIGLVASIEELHTALLEEIYADEEYLSQIDEAFNEFKAETEVDFPGYLVLKAEEIAEFEDMLAAFSEAQNAAAYEALQTGVYEGPSQEELMDLYGAFQALNTGKDEAIAAIAEEYDEDIENINTLTTGLQELNDQVAEDFPGYAVVKAEDFAAVNAMIMALNEQATAGLETAYETGVYEGPSQEELMEATYALQALVTGLEELTLAITEEAEADMDTVNEIALAVQEINGMVDEYTGIANLYADQIAAANATVEALNDQITAGLVGAFETGVYEGPSQADIVDATETVMQLNAEIEATIEALEQAIYEDYEILEELSNTMGAIIDDEEEFPAFMYAYGDEIGAAAQVLNDVVDEFVTAYMTALYETGVYEGPSQEDITNATQLVMGVVTLRAEALAAIENAAQADQDKIQEYYDIILGVLDAEGNEDTAAYQIAQLMNERLAELKEAVANAQAEALNETAEYVSPITAADEAFLDGLAQAFKTSSIYGIGLDANGAIYFDLNGNMIQNPVAGKIYIKIADGKATKTLVK